MNYNMMNKNFFIYLMLLTSTQNLLSQDTITDLRDNNRYKIIRLGNHIWFAENLRYLLTLSSKEEYSEKSNNGLPATRVYNYDGNVPDIALLDPKCRYLEYGVYYNWWAAQTACPENWRLPTYDDWSVLIEFLAYNGYNYDGSTGVVFEITNYSKYGNKLGKSLIMQTKEWYSSDIVGAIGNNDYPEIVNKSGFSARPAGFFDSGGNYYSGNHVAYYSSSTEYSEESSVLAILSSNSTHFNILNKVDKRTARNIRCVSDYKNGELMPIFENFGVYPNPFSDRIMLHLPNADFKTIKVNIYSFTGNLVYSHVFEGGITQEGINLGNLISGMYLCQLISDENHYNVRIQKK